MKTQCRIAYLGPQHGSLKQYSERPCSKAKIIYLSTSLTCRFSPRNYIDSLYQGKTVESVCFCPCALPTRFFHRELAMDHYNKDSVWSPSLILCHLFVPLAGS